METNEFISKHLRKWWIAEAVLKNLSLINLLELRTVRSECQDTVNDYLEHLQDFDMTTVQFVSRNIITIFAFPFFGTVLQKRYQ